jgi:hypothetical protein
MLFEQRPGLPDGASKLKCDFSALKRTWVARLDENHFILSRSGEMSVHWAAVSEVRKGIVGARFRMAHRNRATQLYARS